MTCPGISAKATVLIALWCLLLTECARTAPKRMISLDQRANDTQISAVIGQQIEIALPENPTTGFRWELRQDGAPTCVSEGSRFETSTGGLGKGGTRRWRFEAVHEGSGRIELVYRRPFESDKPPAQVFRIAVRVEK